MDTLGTVIGSKIHAKYKVLITDSCHSGAITPDADAQAYNQQPARSVNSSLFSLTASRDRERSFESAELGRRPRHLHLLRGQGPGRRSRRLTATASSPPMSWPTTFTRNVREATKGQQNPTSDRGSFDPNMLLAYLPSGLRTGQRRRRPRTAR